MGFQYSSHHLAAKAQVSAHILNVRNFRTLFFLVLFSNKMLVFKIGINKMPVRIANREDPDQTASYEAV